MISRFLTTTFLTATFCTLPNIAAAQIWENVSETSFAAQGKTAPSTKNKGEMAWARKVDTDMSALKSILSKAPHERLGQTNVTIDLPLPDGGVGTFTLLNSPIVAPELTAKYPSIQTFRVIDTQNSYNTGRIDITPQGFNGMFRYNGGLVYINPTQDQTAFNTFYESDHQALESHGMSGETACGYENHEAEKNYTPINQKGGSPSANQKISLGTNLRQYRFAVAATGEYTQFFGGTKEDGIAAVATAVNRLNVFFETDMAIRFQLVANNDDLIFTDPETDGITNDDKFVAIDEITDILNDVIGEANYDIGHIFGRGGGGVVSSLRIPCTERKGQGFTGQATPNNTAYMNTMAHEIGHMFGSPHTFNGSTNACGAGQRSTTTNLEPHSGSTFMSYNGLCAAENLGDGSRSPFFHNGSLTVMNAFVEDAALGGSCATLVPITNIIPDVQAGPDSTIPMSTPFTLTGTVSNAGNDALTHIWEQVDSGTPNADENDFADEGTRALFRSFTPTASLSRTFPQLERVLAGDRVLGEVLPSTDRDMTFRMTTRDGMGGVADDERIISVTTAAGPFTIATPAAALEAGVAHDVTWDVANTSAAPVSCAMVSLALSTDGGNTYPHELAAMTPNTGSANVTFPNVTTTTGRLRASCINQPFFAINDANFTMTPMIIINMAPEAVNDALTAVEDSRRVALNVLDNDTDPDGDTLTLASVTQPNQNGATEISGTSILYTPEVGFVGTESFTYVINDGNGNTDSATVTVTVTDKPNEAPGAVNDTASVVEDSGQASIDVLANDTDPDGEALTLTSVSQPNQNGMAEISGTSILYTPAAGFVGTETFTYTVDDGNDENNTDSATVTVTVTEKPNEPPVVPNPTASVRQDSTSTLIDVLANATDEDGDTLTLQSVGAPSLGGTAVIQDGQILYTPATGVSGTETISFTVSDGQGGVVTSSVSVTILVTQVSNAFTPAPSGGGGPFGPLMLLILAIRGLISRKKVV